MTKIDPTKVFWMAVTEAPPNSFTSKEAAANFAREQIGNDAGQFITVECIPRERVFRPAISTEAIKSPRAQRTRRARREQNGSAATPNGSDSSGGGSDSLPPAAAQDSKGGVLDLPARLDRRGERI